MQKGPISVTRGTTMGGRCMVYGRSIRAAGRHFAERRTQRPAGQ